LKIKAFGLQPIKRRVGEFYERAIVGSKWISQKWLPLNKSKQLQAQKMLN
jgi:hypothetical protein